MKNSELKGIKKGTWLVVPGVGEPAIFIGTINHSLIEVGYRNTMREYVNYDLVIKINPSDVPPMEEHVFDIFMKTSEKFIYKELVDNLNKAKLKQSNVMPDSLPEEI